MTSGFVPGLADCGGDSFAEVTYSRLGRAIIRVKLILEKLRSPVEVLFELEVDFPALRRHSEAHVECGSRQPEGALGPADQLHLGLSGGAAPFALVAGLTGGDDILPVLFATLNNG